MCATSLLFKGRIESFSSSFVSSPIVAAFFSNSPACYPIDRMVVLPVKTSRFHRVMVLLHHNYHSSVLLLKIVDLTLVVFLATPPSPPSLFEPKYHHLIQLLFHPHHYPLLFKPKPISSLISSVRSICSQQQRR